MKTKTFISSLAAVAILSSCKDGTVNMSTTLHEDGSCRREVWFHVSDQALTQPDIQEDGYVFGVLDNEAWSKAWEYPEDSLQGQYPMTQEQYDQIKASWEAKCTSGDTIKGLLRNALWVHAGREFESVEAMAEALPLKYNGEPIHSTAKLDKKFRWFYTDYEYTETFQSIAHYFEIPLSDFMTDEEADYWLTGEPNIFANQSGFEVKAAQDQLETNFFMFINTNTYNDWFKIIAEHYDRIPNAPMSREDFEAMGKELLANRELMKFNPLETTKQDSIMGQIEKRIGKEGMMVYKDIMDKDSLLSELWDHRVGQGLYYALVEFNCDYRLTPPGDKIDMNGCGSATYSDGALHYQLNFIRLLRPDYTIHAASRTIHLWAIVLTAAIVLLGIGIIGKRKKDKV